MPLPINLLRWTLLPMVLVGTSANRSNIDINGRFSKEIFFVSPFAFPRNRMRLNTFIPEKGGNKFPYSPHEILDFSSNNFKRDIPYSPKVGGTATCSKSSKGGLILGCGRGLGSSSGWNREVAATMTMEVLAAVVNDWGKVLMVSFIPSFWFFPFLSFWRDACWFHVTAVGSGGDSHGGVGSGRFS